MGSVHEDQAGHLVPVLLGVGPCRTFIPNLDSDVTLTESAAINASRLDGDDQVRLERLRAGDGVIASEAKTVAGYPAMRIVYSDDQPATTDAVEYLIDLPGSVFSLRDVGVYPFDLDAVGATHYAMAESLRF